MHVWHHLAVALACSHARQRACRDASARVAHACRNTVPSADLAQEVQRLLGTGRAQSTLGKL